LGHRTAAEGHRVLVVAPYGRDAESVADLLRGEGYQATACADLRAVAGQIDDSIGAILLTEEALGEDLPVLKARLATQPSWSDVPFVLLAAARVGRVPLAEASRLQIFDLATNSVVLERPLGKASLVSAIASAMRSRQRQFDMRDRLVELEAGRAALAASEAEVRLIADAMPVLVGFVDRDLVYRFANQAYREWFGLDPAEVVGRRVAEVIGADGMVARLPDMTRALGGEPARLELPWPRLDGGRREAEIRYLPRRGTDGAVDGFHVFVLDITERKLIEETLAQRVAERTAALEREMASRTEAEAALRQSQKMEAVGQLTGGIAHDFNNMLTGVIGGLDIIRRRIADGRTQDIGRFMDAASTSAQRAAALTARLLAFSRRQSLDARPLDVNALTASLEDLLRRTIRENVALSIVPGADVGTVVADANQLENAILNLAINARDAMPDGGALTVETKLVTLSRADLAKTPDVEPGRYVVIAVSDTGVGMAPEILEKVFDPFYTTKPLGQGTGLGLSMVYGFARQSGGQVRIHSRPGEGTSVKLFLPASDEDVADAEAPPRDSAHRGHGQTVLLVEDDDSVRLLVRELLMELGYQVVEAADGHAAVPILASDRAIALMVSDVGLPGIGGRQLAEIARGHRAELPILFVTGYAENAAIRSGFLGTNMAMITKPFALDALAEKIEEMVE